MRTRRKNRWNLLIACGATVTLAIGCGGFDDSMVRGTADDQEAMGSAENSAPALPENECDENTACPAGMECATACFDCAPEDSSCAGGCFNQCVETDNPDQAPVDPGEPPVDPGEPPVDPGEPPVDPGEPPVDPGEPPVDPGEPPVDPGEPPLPESECQTDADCGEGLTCQIACYECPTTDCGCFGVCEPAFYPEDDPVPTN